MAIKFDELLEALDSSLDKFEEDLDSMWIIIPTERRYDDLTANDYLKFAKRYGTFNNQKDCFDKIEKLAPDRWDAFIPMKLEGINESLNESKHIVESNFDKADDMAKRISKKIEESLPKYDVVSNGNTITVSNGINTETFYIKAKQVTKYIFSSSIYGEDFTNIEETHSTEEFVDTSIGKIVENLRD